MLACFQNLLLTGPLERANLVEQFVWRVADARHPRQQVDLDRLTRRDFAGPKTPDAIVAKHIQQLVILKTHGRITPFSCLPYIKRNPTGRGITAHPHPMKYHR
jgi:hypothetical protein